MSKKSLSEALDRLVICAQSNELTSDQIVRLREEFERLMKEYDLLPSELSWVLGGIAAVITTENLIKRFGE